MMTRSADGVRDACVICENLRVGITKFNEDYDIHNMMIVRTMAMSLTMTRPLSFVFYRQRPVKVLELYGMGSQKNNGH